MPIPSQADISPLPSPRSAAPLRVVRAEGARERNAFIAVPARIYAGDPAWVAPLRLERRLHLSPRNPFFAHARAALWVAYRGAEPVGRISAQVDELHLARYSDATGQFGFLEAVDDPEVFHALFDTAESWLREQGMRRISGPFSFSINDECGLLIEGFDTPPMFMMPHGRLYYDARVREQGYAKAMDTVAYIYEMETPVPPVMTATLARFASRIRIRPARLSHLSEDLALLCDIFNDAWANNWNFIPFTTAELDMLGASLKLFVPPEFVQIASVDGEPAAMLVAVPNVNEAIGDLQGRLLPFGWAKLLWRLKRRHVRTGRVPLMGMRRAYQRSPLGMALVFALFDAVRRPVIDYGIRRLELSWTLETNRPMHHIKERIGARIYKRFRIYDKALLP